MKLKKIDNEYLFVEHVNIEFNCSVGVLSVKRNTKGGKDASALSLRFQIQAGSFGAKGVVYNIE